MKKLYIIIILLFITAGLFSQSGRIDLKYPTTVPSLRVGGTTKVKLDSIVSNVDTVKFYTGGTELKTKGAGTWTGTGVGLDTTLAKVTLEIDQVTNESKAAMFNDPIFTGVTYFGHSIVPTTPGTGYLGTSSSPVAGLYLGATSPLSWGNSVFLTGGTGQVTLSGGNLNLGANNLLGSGSIGLTGSRFSAGYFTDLTVTNTIAGSITGNAAAVSNYTPAGGSITLSGADAITFNTTATTSLTLPTSGTLLTTAILSGYAPLADANFTGDHTTATVFRPATDGGANLGHPLYGWNALHLNTTGVISWENGDILLGSSSGNLRLENSAFLIDNNDIGLNIYPVRKGYFTDLDIVNLPTLGSGAIATTQNINDSITEYLNNATLGVALADSNIYNGGYLTLTYADSIIEDASNPLLRELRMLGANIISIPISASQLLTSYTNLTENRAYYTAIYINKDTLITGVNWIQRVQGVYTADNFNGIALYSWDGSTATQVAISADDGNCWKGAAYTLQTKAFGSPYNASKGLYYVAFLYNTSSESVAPSIYDWNTVSAVSHLVTGGPKVAGYVGSMNTLPATETAGDMTADGQLHGVWLY